MPVTLIKLVSVLVNVRYVKCGKITLIHCIVPCLTGGARSLFQENCVTVEDVHQSGFFCFGQLSRDS